MIILGVETSCDECSASIVEDGKKIRSNIIATQISEHSEYYGVVPEIASRLHTEWITGVVRSCLKEAGMALDEIDGFAVTERPGLMGSLMVGHSFIKALSFSRRKPYTGVDHILAHLYAPHLEYDITYPYLGLLVSGGHTVIAHVRSREDYSVLGTTIDDAIGEAFDKVSKFYDLGYPGGVAIQNLAEQGDPQAYRFPVPSLHKGDHRFDVSYSGLKTAVINQRHQFINEGYEDSPANIAASFQRSAVDMIVNRLRKAMKYTGIRNIVAGGGVSANSYLRSRLQNLPESTAWLPSLSLCTDNAAMIAGLGYHQLKDGHFGSLHDSVQSRVRAFKRSYP